MGRQSPVDRQWYWNSGITLPRCPVHKSATLVAKFELETDLAGALPRWTFLTNHGGVLLAVATHPNATLMTIAATVGITERAVRSILRDLQEAGYISAERVGRGKLYHVDRSQRMRHPMAADHVVGELLAVLEPPVTD
jgi:DNA-binding transcriptional ArsR family regulator